MKQLLSIVFMVISFVGISQTAQLNVDTTQLRIGEQTVLNLSFEYQNPNGDALVIWPYYEDELTNDIEIIDKTIDAETLIDSATSTYLREQRLKITVFEAGRFTIPKQSIQLGDSVFQTNTATLFVETVKIDTSKSVVDIKPILTVEYPFSERSMDWLKNNWYWLVIILGILLLVWAYKIYQKQETDATEEEVLEEIIPAHILALEKLNSLLKQESWKDSAKKEYYSELTDTVRSYLENRFNIRAMEQTTREIINYLKHSPISESDKAYLRKILREADMVKFAKFTPGDEEAYEYLQKSIDFVKRTKTNSPTDV